MQHYRLYKLSDATGRITTGKDLFARNDDDAVEQAEQDDDCPTCEVWRGATQVASVEGQ